MIRNMFRYKICKRRSQSLLSCLAFSMFACLISTTSMAAVTIDGMPAADPLDIVGSVGSVDATLNSEVNLVGGTADNVTMNDSTDFTATSGAVNFQTTLNDSSSGDISGGTFLNIATNDTASLTIGGTATVNGDLGIQGSSIANITGGTPGLFMFANDAATMNILGGDMGMIFYNNSSTGTISGGVSWDSMSVGNDADVSVIGTGFTLNGSPVSGDLTNTSGDLVGTLQNGDTISVSLDVFSNGVVRLAPEPGAAGLMALAGLICAARRGWRRLS